MSNTITAYFKGRVGVAESVYQNDYGIVMVFDSIDLPAHFDCYFSRLNQEEALPGVGADNRVAIPNSILANPGNVTIHIPLHTGEDDSEVEYVIYFKVIGRARPIDDGTPTQMTAIEQALALLQNPITNIEQIVNEALAFTGETFEEMQEDLDEWKTDTEEGLETWKGGVESDFDTLQAQFDTAVGAVTTDTEVTDIRVGADGITDTTAGASVRRQFSDVKSAISDIEKLFGTSFSHTFAGKENVDIPYPVIANKPFYIKADVDGAGWIYIMGDNSHTMTVNNYYRRFVPTLNNTSIRYYSGSGSGYTGTINFSVISAEEYAKINGIERALKASELNIITNATQLSSVTGGTYSANDFPPNSIICIGDLINEFKDYPTSNNFPYRQGVYITFDGHGTDANRNGLGQIAIGVGGIASRWKMGNWTGWKDSALNFNQYNTRSTWLNAFPSDKLADIPINHIVCLGDSSINPLDAPSAYFSGNVITLCAHQSTLQPGAVQLAFKMLSGEVFRRIYYYNSGGNYWGAWASIEAEQKYYVGTGETYTSLTELLLDLAGNNHKKVIYIREGEYDIFQEYMTEVGNGRLTIPPDNVTAPDYFGTYNAFVPTNTKIVGLGKVTLKMTPTSSEITYGASRTWSPLNIYGAVEIENITVLGHNCRYCLHNDDHNSYPNTKQHYKNCRFIYTKSDLDSQNRRLGFNSTIGFGINAGSTHIFEDCEIVMDSDGDHSAYYGHESLSAKNGFLILKNCRIYSTNFSASRVIKLQNLANEQGKVDALFENCYINGGINLDMFNTDSIQNFDTDLVNCNKVPVTRTIASGGTITDIYTVRWFNPLATPTASNPLIETDSLT